MEYILFLTYRCNLNCSYCFAKNMVHNIATNQMNITDENLDAICKFIEADIAINKRQNNSIVFFGGEPSLVPELILEIIEKTAHLKLKYSIYTNGLLLDVLPNALLEKLQSILIAIDGDKNVHERYKPKGSYDKIINNVKLIKQRTSAQLIARITMEEDTNIYQSVKNLLDTFDFVHWQIVNKNSFLDSTTLIQTYSTNVNRLFQEWIEKLKLGRIQHIIPFNRIVFSLLTNEKACSFRCGCGSSILAIDIAGNIYTCDEYIENQNNAIGSIFDDNFNLISYKKHTDLFQDCSNCEVSSICLGRCRKELETQPIEHIRIYCTLSKILINTIKNHLNEIRAIITNQHLDLNQLHTEIYNTEIIP